MANSPKENEEKINRAIRALKDLAPDKKFGNKGLAELETQAVESFAPRRRLAEIANEETEQIALRENGDKKTLKMIDQIVAGIEADDDYGKDSALYEAFGYKRSSQRKSGLTRKKKGSGEGENK
jgi:hypothetical protein